MKKIEIESMLAYRYLGNLRKSPSGKDFSFIVSKAHEAKNVYYHTLHIYKDNKRCVQIPLKTNHDYLYLTENKLLIDLQKTASEKQALKKRRKQSFYFYDLHELSLTKAFTLPIHVSLIDAIDATRILVSSLLTPEDHCLYQVNEMARETYLKKMEKASCYEEINQLPYYLNGRGFHTNQRKQLFIYDITTDTLEPIVNNQFQVDLHCLSQDRKTIYFTGKPFETIMTQESMIYQYDIQSKTVKEVYGKRTHQIKGLVEVGELFVFATDMNSYGLNQNPDVYHIKDGHFVLVHKLNPAYGNSIGSDCRLLGSRLSDSGIRHHYFVTTVDDHSEIYALSSKGEVTLFYEMDGSIDGLIVQTDGLTVIAMKAMHLQEIYHIGFDQSIKQCTRLNQVFLRRYVAEPKEVVCHKDVCDIKGFVLLPDDFDSQSKYPLILDIHGGPKTVYGKAFYHEMQTWVNKGYIVAYCNPRGSDGKGDAFADIRGRYGTIDYEDIMDFLALVCEQYPQINHEALYVTGGSYGGFMTNWIVSHTSRFKAAVTQRSISNWLSFYGTSDIGYYFGVDQTKGHPLKTMDLLYQQSPIKYALNVRTPLRFIHADKDYRCPIEQAQQFYAILKGEGLDTDFIWFKDETHELSRSGKPQARIKRLQSITEWFEMHKN